MGHLLGKFHSSVFALLLASGLLRVQLFLNLNINGFQFFFFGHLELSFLNCQVVLFLLGQIAIEQRLTTCLLSSFPNHGLHALLDAVFNQTHGSVLALLSINVGLVSINLRLKLVYLRVQLFSFSVDLLNSNFQVLLLSCF